MQIHCQTCFELYFDEFLTFNSMSENKVWKIGEIDQGHARKCVWKITKYMVHSIDAKHHDKIQFLILKPVINNLAPVETNVTNSPDKVLYWTTDTK